MHTKNWPHWGMQLPVPSWTHFYFPQSPEPICNLSHFFFFFRSREASPLTTVSEMRNQLLSVTYLEVNSLSRKVWDHLVTTTQNGLVGANGQKDESEFDSVDEKGERQFSRVSCPAFYCGLFSGEELTESRLETNYRNFAAPKLPDRVSFARSIFRYWYSDIVHLLRSKIGSNSWLRGYQKNSKK